MRQLILGLEPEDKESATRNQSQAIEFNCVDCGRLARCYDPKPNAWGYEPVAAGRCLCCWFSHR
jgi:hypothetical protein